LEGIQLIKREKRRYLAIKVEGDYKFTENAVRNTIYYKILKFFGEYGASQTELKMIKHIPEENQFIIRCSKKMLNQVRAAIVATNEIQGINVTFHVIGVSGTIKSILNKIKI
jgi:RNase P/RNase MRP subunit POP5